MPSSYTIMVHSSPFIDVASLFNPQYYYYQLTLTGDSFTRANVPVAFYLGDPVNDPINAQLIATTLVTTLPAENNTMVSASWNVTALFGPQVSLNC